MLERIKEGFWSIHIVKSKKHLVTVLIVLIMAIGGFFGWFYVRPYIIERYFCLTADACQTYNCMRKYKVNFNFYTSHNIEFCEFIRTKNID